MTDTGTKPFLKNTWFAKARRIATSFLPVDKNREGRCTRCGACCKLPTPCPFLGIHEQGLCICKVYWLRPLNCRKYPRSKTELLTANTCGYSFEETKD